MGGMISMMWSGGIDVIEGRMTGGELGAFVFYAVMVGTAFATLAEVWLKSGATCNVQRALQNGSWSCCRRAVRFLMLAATP